jgi:hypothetical protein
MARLGRFVTGEAVLALLILLVATGLSLSPPAVHDTIGWPFALRFSWEAAAQVPGGSARFLIGAQVAFVGVLAMIVGLLLRPWRVLLCGAGGVALVAGLWVALPPVSVDAYPTTYRRLVPQQAVSTERRRALPPALRDLPRRGRPRRRPRRRGPAEAARRPDRAAHRRPHRGRHVLVAHPRHSRGRHAAVRRDARRGRALGPDQLHPRSLRG